MCGDALPQASAEGVRPLRPRYPSLTLLLRWFLLSLLLLTSCVPQPPPVVKIGLAAPFEGRYRAVGYDAIYAARLAVREINEAGGVRGWRLALVAYDDRASPAMAADVARNLVTDPAVVGVIGHDRRASSEAAGATYATAGMPWLALAPTASSSAALTPAPERLAAAMVALGPQDPPCTAGIWAEGPLLAALEAEVAAGPCRLVPAISPRQAPPPPATLYSALAPVTTAERLARWRALGWEGAVIGGPDLAAADVGQVAGPAAEGVRFVTPYPFPQDLEGTDAWIAAYRAMGPHVPAPGPYALPTYAAVYLLADAIGRAVDATGRPTRERVGDALGAARYQGALGPVAVGHPLPLYTYVWEGGAPRLLRSP